MATQVDNAAEATGLRRAANGRLLPPADPLDGVFVKPEPGGAQVPAFRLGEPEALPAKPCPACGAEMVEGWHHRNTVVYKHLRECPVLEAREQEEAVARRLQLAEAKARAAAGLPPDMPLDLDGYLREFPPTQDTQHGLALAQMFAKACLSGRMPRDGFTLCGAPGAGKSTLAIAVARTLFAGGVRVIYREAPKLYNALLKASRSDLLTERLEELAAVPVLVLDDLAREKPSPWWVDQVLWPLVNDRYTAGRPLVITTNKTWGEMLAKYEGAHNEREQADSAESLVDRLQQRAAAVPFGAPESNRQPEWSFLK